MFGCCGDGQWESLIHAVMVVNTQVFAPVPRLAALLASSLALVVAGGDEGPRPTRTARYMRWEVAAGGPREQLGAAARYDLRVGSSAVHDEASGADLELAAASAPPLGASLLAAEGDGGVQTTTATTTTTTMSSTLVPGGYCAMDGGNCTCEGVVSYGRGSKRNFRRLSGTVPCKGPLFGRRLGSPKHNCICYPLDWCLDKARDDDTKTIDLPHRRRTTDGRKGEGMYQRRRWCGFGPRKCIWGDWGSWGNCSATCGDGTMSRTRSQAQAPQNGGSCRGDPVGTRPCPGLPPCPGEANRSSTPVVAGAIANSPPSRRVDGRKKWSIFQRRAATDSKAKASKGSLRRWSLSRSRPRPRASTDSKAKASKEGRRGKSIF
mmetsp:Transcript_1025/g.3477  ORF Transcript_1025/g.3477 Transcript_1025/m.3477 type:complete len:377 (+) Transcript_1025:96-1226(+)